MSRQFSLNLSIHLDDMKADNCGCSQQLVCANCRRAHKAYVVELLRRVAKKMEIQNIMGDQIHWNTKRVGAWSLKTEGARAYSQDAGTGIADDIINGREPEGVERFTLVRRVRRAVESIAPPKPAQPKTESQQMLDDLAKKVNG